MKQVAIVGIQGVPAKYGGFETLVENIIGDNCSPEVCYTVFAVVRIILHGLILTKVPAWNMFLFSCQWRTEYSLRYFINAKMLTWL